MESSEELTESIRVYELQLAQVNLALGVLPEGSERDDLVELKSDIEELLQLTKESLDSLNDGTNNGTGDPLADEYAQFKAELEELEGSSEELGESSEELGESSEELDGKSDELDGKTEQLVEKSEDGGNLEDKKNLNENTNTSQSSSAEEEGVDIQEDLDELVGTKCQAPYKTKVGAAGYHNALISAVEVLGPITDSDHIQVRVMFTNPTEKDMVPCPYYLDNKCTFEDKCNYSHGHLVPFSELKEFKEPDFSLIKAGSRVLAKLRDHLWQSAVVESVASHESCTLKFEGRYVEVPLHHVLPLTSVSKDSDEDSDLSDCEDELVGAQQYDQDAIVELSLSKTPTGEKLGDWEKYTKGIGSKLLAKMGYIVGTGLGKSGEGRLDPVEATVLPAGKSLDHCMQLKEAAGGSKDLFSAEKIQRKLAMKALKQSQRRYRREKQQEKHDVFNVINKLSSGAGPSRKGKGKGKVMELRKRLTTTSSRELNVERLKAEENMRHTERNIYILKDSLTRHKAGSIPHKNILAKLNTAESQLVALQNFDTKVAREQNLRETKKQLTKF